MSRRPVPALVSTGVLAATATATPLPSVGGSPASWCCPTCRLCPYLLNL